jgi:hypothetical protein
MIKPKESLRGRMTGEFPDSPPSMTAADVIVNVLQVPRFCPQEARKRLGNPLPLARCRQQPRSAKRANT